MRSRSAFRRLLPGRPNSGPQDAGDFPGFLQQGRVLLNPPLFEVFEPVDALVRLFESNMQLRSKRRTRSSLAGSSMVGPDRRRGSQKLTPGVLCLGARRQPTIEGQRGQREAASSLNEVPGRHGTGWKAIRVPRGYSGKSGLYFLNFALLTSLPTSYFRTFYFLRRSAWISTST